MVNPRSPDDPEDVIKVLRKLWRSRAPSFLVTDGFTLSVSYPRSGKADFVARLDILAAYDPIGLARFVQVLFRFPDVQMTSEIERILKEHSKNHKMVFTIASLVGPWFVV